MDPFEHPAVWCWYFWWCYDRLQWVVINRPFGAGHLRGAKLLRWRARYALGQEKRITSSKVIISLSCPGVSLTLLHLHISHNAPYLPPPPPPKFCITFVFHSPGYYRRPKRNWKQCLCHFFWGGEGWGVVGANKVHYGTCASGLYSMAVLYYVKDLLHRALSNSTRDTPTPWFLKICWLIFERLKLPKLESFV